MMRRIAATVGGILSDAGRGLVLWSLNASPDVTSGTEPRAYYTWRWNSPGRGAPPVMILDIDDLNLGRPYHATLSPSQAKMLCEHGQDAVESQMRQFGDVEPRDYDTTKVWRL